MRNDNNLFIGHFYNAMLPIGLPSVYLLSQKMATQAIKSERVWVTVEDIGMAKRELLAETKGLASIAYVPFEVLSCSTVVAISFFQIQKPSEFGRAHRLDFIRQSNFFNSLDKFRISS